MIRGAGSSICDAHPPAATLVMRAIPTPMLRRAARRESGCPVLVFIVLAPCLLDALQFAI